jgi:hypothetical protein
MPSGIGSRRRRENSGRFIANGLRENEKPISGKLGIEKFPRPSPAGLELRQRRER